MSLAAKVPVRLILLHAGLCGLGALGGFAAQALGLPLPFMLGSLITVALFAQAETALSGGTSRVIPEGFKFNERFRAFFVAMIGLSIGAQLTWAVVAELPKAALSFAGLTIFVPLVFWVNYLIFRRIGRYDHPTSLFSAAPGGLHESILLGEQAGADIRLLTLSQFLRIIFVVTLLPIGMSLYIGHPVGSSAGMSLSHSAGDLGDLPLVIVLGLVGLVFGHLIRVPAPQLIGPLILSAIVALSGLTLIEAPQWMINLAQLVIGTSLGTRFSGLGVGMLVRGAWLSFLTVVAMFAIGGAMAWAIMPLTGQAFDVLLISFSPGGVTEMALVALSLNANPAFVTMHHLYRIILTVFVIVRASNTFAGPGPKP